MVGGADNSRSDSVWCLSGATDQEVEAVANFVVCRPQGSPSSSHHHPLPGWKRQAVFSPRCMIRGICAALVAQMGAYVQLVAVLHEANTHSSPPHQSFSLVPAKWKTCQLRTPFSFVKTYSSWTVSQHARDLFKSARVNITRMTSKAKEKTLPNRMRGYTADVISFG